MIVKRVYMSNDLNLISSYELILLRREHDLDSLGLLNEEIVKQTSVQSYDVKVKIKKDDTFMCSNFTDLVEGDFIVSLNVRDYIFDSENSIMITNIDFVDKKGFFLNEKQQDSMIGFKDFSKLKPYLKSMAIDSLHRYLFGRS